MEVISSFKRYGNKSLSDTFHVDPSVEHFFTDVLSLRAGYTFSMEGYAEDVYKRGGYDNTGHMVYGGPVLYLGERRHILSGTFGYKITDADSDQQSYDMLTADVSWFSSFPTGTVFVSYRWSTRDYDAPIMLYSNSREDDRNTFVAVIAQNFFDHYFAAFEFAYVKNSSNSDLYDFDKKTYTVSVGVTF